MTHLFPVALDHGLQFFDTLGRGLAPVKTVQPVNDGQHPDNEIDIIHAAAILPQLLDKQYRQITVAEAWHAPAAGSLMIPIYCTLATVFTDRDTPADKHRVSNNRYTANANQIGQALT